MALRQDLPLSDMEFIQFHPTGEQNIKASDLNEINSVKDSITEIYNKYFRKDIHSNW